MYDVIHFEALGSEADHLHKEIESAASSSIIPSEINSLITEMTIQDYSKQHPDIQLPSLITIKTHSKIPEMWLSSPTNKAIVTRSAGYDHIENLSGSVHIASLREYCVKAVAQTAIKLLYAAAGQLNAFTSLTGSFERNKAPSFWEIGKDRSAVVFGVGKIGKAIYDLLEGNGVEVYGVDIRYKELSQIYGDSVHFLSPDEAMKKSDIIINAMNLTKESSSRFFNVGYFSNRFLSLSSRPIIFINVTRGEIAPEELLLKKLDDGAIYGLGLDIFSSEAELAKELISENQERSRFQASKELIKRSIERSANIYVQPHQGFNSDVASRNKAKESVKLMAEWLNNGRFNEELPYY